MKIYTISDGAIDSGAKVTEQSISGGKITIATVEVGETGRNRRLAYVCVTGADAGDFITNVRLGETRSGQPKFIAIKPAADTDPADKVVVVMPEPIGYRGGNSFTGDRSPEWSEENRVFLPWPGQNLVTGQIAQGDAGAMGSGTQLIAVMPVGTVFRVGYSGRRYSSPTAYYYIVAPEGPMSATWDERAASDCF